MLQLLLTELLLNIEAEGHWALVFLAVFSMVAAQGNKLLADRTPSIGFSLAAFGVLYNSLHLLT